MTKTTHDARERFRALAPVEFDITGFLPARARFGVIDLLTRAADAADDIFWQQASPQATAAELLTLAGDDEELKQMVLFHAGPYDRMNDNSPFLPVDPKPPGAAFYPPDLSREEFSEYIRKHPGDKNSLESPYTVIRRGNGSGLKAIPYHEAYVEQVATLSRLLAEASDQESHAGFRGYLRQRAHDLRTDDYYPSDSLWVGLTDNPLDLVLGPLEVYEDQLLGLKAAYEAILLARDFAESATVAHFQAELPTLCGMLEDHVGKQLRIENSRVALSVANLIYTGGDARKAIPAIAFSLPNDERVIEEVGSRQIILRNVLEAKFRLVGWPIHQRVLAAPPDDEETAFRGFLDHTLLHELSHAIGPHRIICNGESTTVNRCLKHNYAVLEEAKADVLAACLFLETREAASSRTFLNTYVAGFLRAIRFGLADPHGGAHSIQFNFLREKGAIAPHPDTGQISVQYEAARQALLELASTIVGIQERGDFQAAERFVSKFCVMSPDISRLLGRVADLPIDICIRFKSDRHTSPRPQLAGATVTT